MRYWFVLLVALVASAAEKEWTKQWPVTGKPDLRVEVDDGRVIITGGIARQIEARVYATGWEIGPDGVRITEHQTGDRVELEVRVPRTSNWFHTGNRSLRVELRVPREIVASIRTGDGSITADGLAGAVRLKTGDGRIEANGMDGSLTAETGDGSIRIKGRLDVMNIRTGDGSIEADLSSGSKMASAWDVQTGDGHVTLRLPEGFAADLDVHTNDGHVDVGLPVTMQGAIRDREVRGKLNGGGPSLRVRTGDGGIRLARL